MTKQHFCKILWEKTPSPGKSQISGNSGSKSSQFGVVGSDHSLNQKVLQHSYLRLRASNLQKSVLQNSSSYLRPNRSSFQKINDGHVTGMV